MPLVKWAFGLILGLGVWRGLDFWKLLVRSENVFFLNRSFIFGSILVSDKDCVDYSYWLHVGLLIVFDWSVLIF